MQSDHSLLVSIGTSRQPSSISQTIKTSLRVGRRVCRPSTAGVLNKLRLMGVYHMGFAARLKLTWATLHLCRSLVSERAGSRVEAWGCRWTSTFVAYVHSIDGFSLLITALLVSWRENTLSEDSTHVDWRAAWSRFPPHERKFPSAFQRVAVSIQLGLALATCGCDYTTSMSLLSSFLEFHEDILWGRRVVCMLAPPITLPTAFMYGDDIR